MSASSAMGDSGRLSGNRMSFSQTCNLLSKYVKEKRASVSGNTDYRGPTMNLFPGSEKQGTSTEEDSNGCVGKTINLFPQLSGFNSSGNKRASPEPPSSQMTIFYGGQVLVFNDLPADKAQVLMDLASNFDCSQKKRKAEATSSTPSSPVAVPASGQNTKSNLNPTMNSNQNLTVAPSFGKNVIPAAMPRVSDLPITRKASLHRFLEKRKDRLVGKPPADVANGGSGKPLEGKAAWLGLNSVPVFQMQMQKQQQQQQQT